MTQNFVTIDSWKVFELKIHLEEDKYQTIKLAVDPCLHE